MTIRVHTLLGACAVAALATAAAAQSTITIATVNNGDMIRMQGLTEEFTKAHPDIKVQWVTLEENILRERVTTDVATGGGQYDIMTIGNYEVPIWGKQGWLAPLEFDAAYDVDDLLPSIRGGLTQDGKLFAAPFYGESAMIMYRTDLFEKAGLTMPENPDWAFIADAARKVTDREAGINGICLRGKAGWGENMALVGSLANSFGARWFDENWQPQFDSPEWKAALQFYADIMKDAGPAGASSNGFNENLTLFQQGKCAMWVDATSAGSFVSDPDQSTVADKVAYTIFPDAAGTGNHGNWLWSWNLAIPASSKNAEAAETFIAWATDKAYTELVAAKEWAGPTCLRHPDLALREPEVPGRCRLRRRGQGGDGRGRHHQADGQARALHRRPVRRDPRVPGDRHRGRPGRGGARRPVHGGRRARPVPGRDQREPCAATSSSQAHPAAPWVSPPGRPPSSQTRPDPGGFRSWRPGRRRRSRAL